MRATADEDAASTQDEPYSVRLASKYASVSPASHAGERRQYSRKRDQELHWVRSVRLKSGKGVSLVDLSAGGALVDTDVPLKPGAVLSLEIVGTGLEEVVTLQVLRCHVAALLANTARYRGACAFARPIELPGLHPLPDLSAPSGDAFVGVDTALKRLVERAYAVDVSQRLAAGDVLLVLQSLARRALNVESDPLGRHVGNLLQELLPALRHGHGLGAALAAIERQLCHALPEARIRLADRTAPPPADARSVLITAPGDVTPTRAVRIDLPAGTAVSETQSRLLRTSSRLIALVQGLNGVEPVENPARDNRSIAGPFPTGGTASRTEPETPGPSPSWQKIVVRYADGQTLKGYTHDFHGSRSQFSLWPTTTAAAHERVVVPLARLKAVFFVREFAGNPDHIEQKVFEYPAHGRRIEVTLLDNEVLVGTTLNYRTDSAGFFMSPADPNANNLRVFVVSSAVRQVRFP